MPVNLDKIGVLETRGSALTFDIARVKPGVHDHVSVFRSKNCPL